jgi:HD-GYP domain-containing protein (c-di-GMP phosphodiesterase class II)
LEEVYGWMAAGTMTLPDSSELLEKAISDLNAAISSVGLYPKGHPWTTEHTLQAYERFVTLLRYRPQIKLMVVMDHLTSDDKPLIFSGVHEEVFRRTLLKRGVEAVTFIRGLPYSELEQFIHHIGSTSFPDIHSGTFIKVGKVHAPGGSSKTQGIDDIYRTLESIEPTVLDLTPHVETVKKIYHAMLFQNRLDTRAINEVIEITAGSIDRDDNPLKLMAAMKSADDYTFTHASNVAVLTMFQAEALGFKGSHLKDVGFAALFHDIGKTHIPAQILGKPDKLATEEWVVMQTHPLHGARHLTKLQGITRLAGIVALEHHIQYDGGGYPYTGGEWRPHLVSQLVSIADTFDALKTVRPYRDALSQSTAIDILLKGCGTQLNPALVRVFIRLLER